MKKVIVNSVVEYIEQSLELFRVDIDCLVKYSGYSRRQLQLIFREYTGMPLGKYIRSRRICRSALLLRLTTLPLSEISNRLFYDSQQSFQREFKKSIGITPLSYRKKNVWGGGVAKFNTDWHYELSYCGAFFLEKIKLSGTKITYKECIPFYGGESNSKWDIISEYVDKHGGEIIIAHDFKACQEPSDKVLIDSCFFMDENEATVNKNINGGWYCLFYFYGSKEAYLQAISALYVHLLSPSGLSRGEGVDIEVIRKINNNTYAIYYYLPVVLCS
ncbi:helix-turn-helix transcriptional regulator [Escherichia coli]